MFDGFRRFFGRNRQSRPSEAAGRGNSPEAKPRKRRAQKVRNAIQATSKRRFGRPSRRQASDDFRQPARRISPDFGAFAQLFQADSQGCTTMGLAPMGHMHGFRQAQRTEVAVNLVIHVFDCAVSFRVHILNGSADGQYVNGCHHPASTASSETMLDGARSSIVRTTRRKRALRAASRARAWIKSHPSCAICKARS